MATTTNLGSQFITFDFRHPAKGSAFGRFLRTIIKPGIYTGFVPSTVAGNNIDISAGSLWMDAYDANNLVDNLAVHAEAQDVINATINQTLGGENEVLYFYYEYAENADNYFDVRHTNRTNFEATAPANSIVVCDILYDGGGNITGFDTTTKTFGLFDDSYNLILDKLATFKDIVTFEDYFDLQAGGFYLRDHTLTADFTVPSGKQMIVIGTLDTGGYTLNVPVDSDLIVIGANEPVNVPPDGVGTGQIQDGAVTKAKLGFNGVAEEDIAAGGTVDVDYSRIVNGIQSGVQSMLPSAIYAVSGASRVVAISTYSAADTDRNKFISCSGNIITNNSTSLTIEVQYIGIP